MKTLEINGKSHKNQEIVLTKLIISHLIIALEYQTKKKSHHKKIGYNINVLQQTACLVVNTIMVGNFAFLFNCTLVGRTSDSMMVST